MYQWSGVPYGERDTGESKVTSRRVLSRDTDPVRLTARTFYTLSPSRTKGKWKWESDLNLTSSSYLFCYKRSRS